MQSFLFFRNLSYRSRASQVMVPKDMDRQKLVERCKSGDERAMSLLYSEYAGRLAHICRKFVDNEQDVQDIVHDSFVVILTSMDRLKDYRKLESWMFMIVRNLSLKHLQQPSLANVENVEIADGNGLDSPDFEKLMVLVEQLPAGYKNVLKLSVLEGLSHKEIGEMLGIGAHSSSSQLVRAKELMRKKIVRCGVLLIAIVLALVPILLEEEKVEEQIVKSPKDLIGKAEDVDFIGNPQTIKLHETVKHTDLPSEKKMLQFVAEVVEKDFETKQPIDTTQTDSPENPRLKQNASPNIQPNERLIADDYQARIKKDDEWNLTIVFAGGNGNDMLASAKMPGNTNVIPGQPIGPGNEDPLEPSGTDNPSDNPDIIQSPDTLVKTRTHHPMPISFGMTLSRNLSQRWSVETGLRYTLLRTDVTTVTSVSDNSIAPVIETTHQKYHYLGIPLKLTYSLWRTPVFSLYTNGGAAADIPVGASNPVLWSINFGAGLQYLITPSISIYTEPNLNCFLNANSGPATIRTERPLELTIPVGLRFSW